MTLPDRSPPAHGGRLDIASRHYGIARAQWLDLSTGINPWPFPMTPIDAAACRALPDANADLIEAAEGYYFNTAGFDTTESGKGIGTILAIPGSQWAIERLPYFFEKGVVALPDIGYREHAWCWQTAGHEAMFYDPDRLETSLFDDASASALRAVVVINPNNPGGQHHSRECLCQLAGKLAEHGVFLVVDEAFADTAPDKSLLPGRPDNVLVLRSLGKFFGLAGLRLGFAIGAGDDTSPLGWLQTRASPWMISSPAQTAGREALEAKEWQRRMRERLSLSGSAQGQWWLARLKARGAIRRHRTGTLFNGFDMASEQAQRWHEALARQGVLTRLWQVDKRRAIIRIGLHDENDATVRRLEQALLHLPSGRER